MAAPGRECHTLSERRKEHRGGTEAAGRTCGVMKRKRGKNKRRLKKEEFIDRMEDADVRII